MVSLPSEKTPANAFDGESRLLPFAARATFEQLSISNAASVSTIPNRPNQTDRSFLFSAPPDILYATQLG